MIPTHTVLLKSKATIWKLWKKGSYIIVTTYGIPCKFATPEAAADPVAGGTKWGESKQRWGNRLISCVGKLLFTCKFKHHSKNT